MKLDTNKTATINVTLHKISLTISIEGQLTIFNFPTKIPQIQNIAYL